MIWFVYWREYFICFKGNGLGVGVGVVVVGDGGKIGVGSSLGKRWW